ncbi:UNVERIFIED_CONTAM: hypothetical protein K2H54_000776 [Gekko kuhli]
MGTDGSPPGLTDDEDIKVLLKGSLLWKIKGRQQQKQRLHRLQEDGMTVWFETRFKRAHSKHVCHLRQAVVEGTLHQPIATAPNATLFGVSQT